MSNSKKKYSEDEVIMKLRRKSDCRVLQDERIVMVLTGQSPKSPKSHDLGNGSWGKIDYLTKHCGYRKVNVHDFPGKKERV